MREDLTGRTFGRLTVLRQAGPEEAKRGRRYWVCLCSCGKQVVVEGTHLRTGHTKSCGCYRGDSARSRRMVDISGQRFGRLTVLEPVNLANGADPYWKCRCDCGKEIVCKKENLLSGSTQSCGCLMEETRKENMKKAIHFVEGTCIEKISCRSESKSNTSGHRGVYKRENNRWRATIGFQGRVYNLGTFGSFEEAVEARVAAEKRMYDPFLRLYHENSGKNVE